MPATAISGGLRENFSGSKNSLLVTAAVSSSFQYKDLILKRYSKTSHVRMLQFNRPATANLPYRLVSANRNVSWEPYKKLDCFSSTGNPLLDISAASTQLLSGDHGSLKHKIPLLPRRCNSSKTTQAFKGNSYSLRYPVITKKPKWGWRILACVPYLMSLQMSNTASFLLPLLEYYEFDNLIFYIPGVIQKLPMWFPMLYFNLAYFGVVRNQNWPHFLRFHVMLGMLLETALDIVWYSSNFWPLIHYNGTYAMQYWGAVGVIYIFIVSECIRSIISGTYAKMPFLSESALIHTLFEVGRYYRPF